MPRALIVDDIDENIYFLRALLTAHGYEVSSAHNGLEALSLAGNVLPDLIITDLLMPVMDGFTLCLSCRETPALADVPIIVYTATYTDPGDEELALNQGADLFLVRPMEPAALMEAINVLMRAHAAGQRSRRPLCDRTDGLTRQYNSVLVHKLEDKLEELGASQQKLKAILEGMSQGLISVSSNGTISSVNRRIEEMFGYVRSELVGQNLELLVPESQRERHALHEEQYHSKPSIRPMGMGLNLLGRRKDGSEFPVEIGLSYTKDGDNVEVIALVSDITERRRLEEQLRGAQRLEAIGRLSGGLAHDFNNLLMIIIGQSTAMQMDPRCEPNTRAGLESISHAAERAAKLIAQLLAFSRRQVLQPKIINLNAEIENLDRILSRLIGDDIKITTVLAPDLWTIKADPTQIGQVIMNLALNARDAMAKGGVLTIETQNVEVKEAYAPDHGTANPGSYVLLAVTDTGMGMNKETMARMFDPFYTTKGQERGTGLGLSTVHGIVMQSGGHICVTSDKDKGSSFKLYLPQASEAKKPPAPVATDAIGLRGIETILLVEDEPQVRKMMQMMLQRHGYMILTAEDFEEAKSTCIQYQGDIHLLLTDMVIPGGTGQELSAQIQELRPMTRVLYMSGYTANSIVPDDMLEAGINFLQKPFAPSQLAKKVRDVLDAVGPESR